MPFPLSLAWCLFPIARKVLPLHNYQKYINERNSNINKNSLEMACPTATSGATSDVDENSIGHKHTVIPSLILVRDLQKVKINSC